MFKEILTSEYLESGAFCVQEWNEFIPEQTTRIQNNTGKLRGIENCN